jgi:hypothetical protein
VAAAAPGYGYLVPPGEAAAGGIVRFLDAGGRARVVSRASRFAGRDWPAGSWFLPAAGNDSLQQRASAAGLGAFAVPVASGMAESGVDLGSGRASVVRLPKVALLSGEGVSPLSFGAHWFFLEQRLGLPFTALPAADLARADLARYDVIVLPDASGRALDEAGRKALREWTERGGRLVAVDGGAAALAETFDVATRAATDPTAEEENSRARLLRGREQRERDEWDEQVPGAIIEARLDPAHPLAWGAGLDGAPERIFLLHSGTLVFEPAEGVESVVHFSAEPARISGVIAPAQLERLGEGAWLATKRVGRGSVALFAGDPLFRLFWRATEPLYVNALLLGPR